ncbi:MAG TPA: YqgE/AlgH family protein [Bryobacteraceae bacterium]|nr:YqgE/AlgH family protein [Bryobacteraceae bacterium]
MAWRCSAALFFLLALIPAEAQDELGPGKLLVAARELGDPNFAHAVVLLIDYNAEKGTMGLIVNRQTDMPVSRLLADVKEAKGRTDPIYVGGPVELTTVLGLMKTLKKPESAKLVFGDVYLMNTKDLLEKALAAKPDSSSFHVFVGYAGWGAGQLEHEVELGAWHVMPPDAGLVFHSDPESVWPRLIRRTEQQIAQNHTYRRREHALLARARRAE